MYDTRRSKYPECPGSCMGVDPNRNWEYQWGTGGSSSNCCSDTFKGPSAFSEIEVISSRTNLRVIMSDENLLTLL